MSNSLSIAAVTATIRDLLSKVSQPLPFDPDPDADLNDAVCTTKPPDKARQNESANQVNLFLYSTAWNAALRNADLPQKVRPNESAMPPVALNLYYLVTAYGRNFDDLLSHRLLGRAMSILHDRAVLLATDIDKALKGNDLGKQIERVRITPHPISNEELSKLWTVFQTPYRISVSYEAAVVLIDSARRTKAPPPVLSRGVGSIPSALPPFPELTGVTMPLAGQPSARLPAPAPPSAVPGDTVIFTGHDLEGTTVFVHLDRALFTTPLVLDPVAGGPTSTAIPVAMPADQTILPPGLYKVTAQIRRGTPAQDLFTNAVSLAVAPRIRELTTSPRDGQGRVNVTVRMSPQIWPGQRVTLIVGDQEIISPPRTTATDTVVFVVTIGPGVYHVRVRVDGVDSFLVDYAASPPAYDATQTVTLP